MTSTKLLRRREQLECARSEVQKRHFVICGDEPEPIIPDGVEATIHRIRFVDPPKLDRQAPESL
jgi:hypothetical protein